jgi:hypothetical protein
MADAEVDERLPYGWFPKEMIHGRGYRWAGTQAAALIHLSAPARRMRLEYAHVPVDTGGVELSIRRLGQASPLSPVWSTRLRWQYIERCIENHPTFLPAGDYEVVFRSRHAWSDPPFETRPLGFALALMSFHESSPVGRAEVNMASNGVEDQLVSGWFETEDSPDGPYRWAGRRAAAVVRLQHDADAVRISYCLPPAPNGGLTVTVRPLGSSHEAWSTRIPWTDASWHDDSFPAELGAGEYLVSFDAESTWSNPGRFDRSFSAENRSLGFAMSRLSFGDMEVSPP